MENLYYDSTDTMAIVYSSEFVENEQPEDRKNPGTIGEIPWVN